MDREITQQIQMDGNVKINLARVSLSINIHIKNYPATLIL